MGYVFIVLITAGRLADWAGGVRLNSVGFPVSSERSASRLKAIRFRPLPDPLPLKRRLYILSILF